MPVILAQATEETEGSGIQGPSQLPCELKGMLTPWDPVSKKKSNLTFKIKKYC